MKLATIFMLSFLVVCLIVSFVFGGYFSYEYNKNLKEEVHENLRNIVEIHSHELDGFLTEQKEKIMIIANLNLLEHNFKSINMGSKEDLDELNHELKEILNNNNNFEEIDVLNNNGIVIAATNLESIGKREFRDVEFLEGKSEAHISEVHYSDVLKKLVIDVSSNVFVDETKERLGIIVAVITLDELAELTSSRIGLDETGEVYIIDRDKHLITPSSFLRGSGVLVQKVDTENVGDCFDENVEGHFTRTEPVISFIDYQGEEAIGSHLEILEADWCLIAEMNNEEAIGIPQKEFIKNQIMISIFFLIFFTLMGFFVGRFLDKKYILKERRGKRNET